MEYKTLITNLGLAKIATALANSTAIDLTTMVLGDGLGNPVETPDVTATDLLREVWDGTLSYLKADVANPNRFIAEAVVPAVDGGFTVREVGIRDSDGDLIVVANFPDVYKPDSSEGATRDLVIRIYFEVSNASAITIDLDVSVVVATRSWVESNFNLAALLPGGLTGQILRKKSNADGDTEWFDPTLGLNIIVDVVEEQQTLAAGQTIVDLAIAGTDGAAYYVEGVRLHPGDFTVNTATRITLAESYPAGSKILIVQNDAGSGFQFLRTADNLSDVPNKATARGNLGLLSDATYLNDLWKLMNQKQYPVGEIFITRQSGDPATLLGFGTWERYGSGRTVVSLDPADASFNSVDKTGGAKTHVLTAGEMPIHGHAVNPPSTITSTGGDHRHFIANANAINVNSNNLSASNYLAARDDDSGNSDLRYQLRGTGTEPTVGRTSTDGGHTHTLNIPEFTSGSAGGGQAHNNLQPYIVLNIWKRTA